MDEGAVVGIPERTMGSGINDDGEIEPKQIKKNARAYDLDCCTLKTPTPF